MQTKKIGRSWNLFIVTSVALLGLPGIVQAQSEDAEPAPAATSDAESSTDSAVTATSVEPETTVPTTTSLESDTPASTTTSVESDTPAPTTTSRAPEMPSNEPSDVLPSGRDAGWNRQWGMLFSFDNGDLTNFSAPAVGGDVGLAYFLNSKTALRLGLELQRQHNPIVPEVTQVDDGSGQPVETAEQFPGFIGTTDFLEIAVGADLMHRFVEANLSPYVGGGLQVGWNRSLGTVDDDYTNPNLRTVVNNTTNNFNMGVHGVLGGDWRFHDHFSLFLEYGLYLDIYRYESIKNETITEQTVNGQRTVGRETTKIQRPHVMEFDTAIGHGGRLGLVVHFF